MLACLLGLVSASAAQEDRPQITPGERKWQKKKDPGPRAVGILQMTAAGKVSLVPIAILVNGKFWDATAYKADPVPMSLDSGTIYEGEQTGSSLGLFTVGSALRRNNPTSGQPPWIGTGTWRPTGTEPPATGIKAEPAPAGIEKVDEPPRLTHDVTPKDKPPASTPPPAQPKPGGSSGSGDEPPRLSKPAQEPSSTSNQPAAPPAESDSSKPKDSKPADSKTDSAAKIPASDSGASESGRPKLRRGRPAVSFVDEDVPGYSKPGARSADAGKDGKIVVATAAASADMKLIPAISDAAGPTPKSFVFEWLKGEEEDRRKQITDMARDQVRAYVDAKAKGNIVAKPATPARKVAASKAPLPILENVQMIAYDLWVSNQPVMVLSAQAHVPPSPSSTAQADPDLQYSVVVVAYPDIYNNLKKLYVGITDKYHLDVTPRLELIDVVDADGDGRGELLFRQTTDLGSGWVIYRATADKLWKMYDSLNPL